MGVSTYIYLPIDVRVEDVATVMGVLLGLPKEKQAIAKGSWFVKVPGASVSSTTIPEMVNLRFEGAGTKPDVHLVFYHFEGKDPRGLPARILGPRSTPLWIAVGLRLVDFFGGCMTYKDDSATVVNVERLKRWRTDNSPEEGEDWQRFQQDIFDLVPLTKEDLQRVAQYAAYQE